MAKCDLLIELDDPDRIYTGGDKIKGTVRVLADADVKCKGLEVQTNWRTHGRGNVASGTCQSETLFAGDWSAGQTETYRFELDVPDWPPSYHGSYINVDHYVDARAKIPWAFDPKTSREYVMRPTSIPDLSRKPPQAVVSGCVGNAIGILFLIIFFGGFFGMCVGLLFNPIIAIVAGLIGIPIVVGIAAKFLLPKWLLGKVDFELLTPEVAPGGMIEATMGFRPRKRTAINGITAKLTGKEICVSGSGSNRTTHRNEFFNELQTLEDATVLEAGAPKDFKLQFQVPGDVPYSFDLDDNDLDWEVELRVDIPRWPDWATTMKVQIVPDGRAQPIRSVETPTASQVASEPAEITFAETASHLWEYRRDHDQVDVLVDAVTGLVFEMEVFVERRLLYSGDEDPHVYQNGYAVWARHVDPPLPLVLYVPHELGDEFEQAGRDVWKCRGSVIGWDHQHDRLQIKVLPHSSEPS